MYRMQGRVQFSEMDEHGRMTIPAIMNRMQNCSDRQSEDLGIGYDFLEARKRGWVIATWQIFFERRPARPDLTDSYVRNLTDSLRRQLGCAVRLTPGATHANGKHTKGVLEIDFQSNDDLDRVLNLMGVTLD